MLVELLCAPIVVGVVHARWSCRARLLLWPSYVLGGAAVRAYCCGRRTRLLELLCVPIVVAVVCARWSCGVRLLLWPSYALCGAALHA